MAHRGPEFHAVGVAEKEVAAIDVLVAGGLAVVVVGEDVAVGGERAAEARLPAHDL